MVKHSAGRSWLDKRAELDSIAKLGDDTAVTVTDPAGPSGRRRWFKFAPTHASWQRLGVENGTAVARALLSSATGVELCRRWGYMLEVTYLETQL